MSSTNIYVLRLEGGRYYIGKSDNVINRYKQHLSGNGSAWTKKYKPVSLENTIENVSSFEEDKITKEYMSKYGIDKVRGGSYVEVELSKFHTDALKMEIWGAKDLCTQCGRKGHWVKDCHYKTDVLGEKSTKTNKKEETCYRCGRPGHYSPDCYAKTHCNGDKLDAECDSDSDSDDDFDDDSNNDSNNYSENDYDDY